MWASQSPLVGKTFIHQLLQVMAMDPRGVPAPQPSFLLCPDLLSSFPHRGCCRAHALVNFVHANFSFPWKLNLKHHPKQMGGCLKLSAFLGILSIILMPALKKKIVTCFSCSFKREESENALHPESRKFLAHSRC